MTCTFENFVKNDNEYYCDVYCVMDICHCLKCHLSDDPFNVCFDCYEQKKHLDHEKILGHKVGKILRLFTK